MAWMISCVPLFSAIASAAIPPIIDTHVHNADITHINYTFTTMFPDLVQNWTMASFTRAATTNSKATMRGVVLMELDKAEFTQAVGLREAGFFQATAEACDLLPSNECIPVLGIVATAPIHDGGDIMRSYLAELLRVAPRVRAVRQAIWKKGTDFFLSESFEAGLRELVPYNLPFDLLVKNWQLGDIAILAQKVPDVKFNLNHIGYPDIVNATAESTQRWKEDISALAALPNVYCKLSGLPQTYTQVRWLDNWQSILPYVSHVIHSFGAKRVNFAGNWFVLNHDGWNCKTGKYDCVHDSYAGVIDLFETLMDALQLSGEDMELIFAGTAIELYQLDNGSSVFV